MTATKIPASLVVGGGTGGDDYVYNPVKDHGAVGDSTTDDTAALQSTFNDAIATGGLVTIPHGRYLVTSPTTNFATTLSMEGYNGFTWSTPILVNVEGQGAGNTCIISGTTSKYAMKYYGSTTPPAAPHLYSSIKNLSFGGTARGSGLYLYDAAFFKVEDCLFHSLDVPLYLESVLSCEFNNLVIGSNFSGVYSTKGTGFSGPNAISFNKCCFSCEGYGFRNEERLSNVTFTSCNFEGNGTHGVESAGGMDINVNGADGNVGVNLYGCYFEGNGGGYDIKITNTGSTYVTHTIKGCNFNRISSTKFVTNNIRSIGKNIILLDGCTFKGYGTYVESAARPYINYDSNTIIIAIGCQFDSASAMGALSQNANFQTMYGVTGYLSHTATAGFTANNCATGFSTIGGNLGFVSRHTTYPFTAQNASDISFWDIGTLNGGWMTLGAPTTSQTPGIGFRSSSSTTSDRWDSQIYASGGNGDTGQGTLTLSARYTFLKEICPVVDNNFTCGNAANRWSVIYAGSGTINTSDARCKEDIQDLSDVELDVAKQLKGCIKKFRYKDAVKLKGDDARTHIGVIAQEVKEIFEKAGLDPFAYGVLCYDEWEDSEAVVSEDGTVLQEAQVAGNRYGVRYDELFAFILAAM